MKKDFYLYISDSVYLLKESQSISYERIASYLNVSESFIKKVHSYVCPEHYNIKHLWDLSILFNVSVEDMLPPKKFNNDNYKCFKERRPESTKDSFKNYLNEILPDEEEKYEK